MGKPEPGLPKVLNQKTAKRLLQDAGFVERSGGRHQIVMIRVGHPWPIALPHHSGNDYGPQLRKNILRQAGLLNDNDEGEG